jgi:hypothetical protein
MPDSSSISFSQPVSAQDRGGLKRLLFARPLAAVRGGERLQAVTIGIPLAHGLSGGGLETGYDSQVALYAASPFALNLWGLVALASRRLRRSGTGAGMCPQAIEAEYPSGICIRFSVM